MVRVGGMGYTCKPEATIGNRINDMTLLSSGEPIKPGKSYVVAGWASVNEGVDGPPIFELMDTFIGKQEVVDIQPNKAIKVI